MGRAFTTEEFRLTKAAIGGMIGHEAKDYEPGQWRVMFGVLQDFWHPG
jgi:hypothetical protein